MPRIRRRKDNKKRKIALDEEITSDEDESYEQFIQKEYSSSDEEHETAQQKKVRLARSYLKQIEAEEKKKLGNSLVTPDIIGERLKSEHLRSIGALRIEVADNLKLSKESEFRILKARESKPITSLCLSVDGKYLFTASKGGHVVKWDLKTEERLHHSSVGVTILDIAISADNKYLAAVDNEGQVHIFNPENLEVMIQKEIHKGSITGVTFDRAEHVFYTSCKNLVKVWHIADSKTIEYRETLHGHHDQITSIDSITKDRVITSGGMDFSIRLWKIPEESQLVYQVPFGVVDVVKFIDKDHFASGHSIEGTIAIWHCFKKKPVCSVKEAHGVDPSNGTAFWIRSLAVVVNGDVLASGSNSGSVKVWKLGDKYRTIDLLFDIPIVGFVNDIVFDLDGSKLIVATSKEPRLGRWDVLKQAKNCIVVIPFVK